MLKHLSLSESEADAFCAMLDSYLPPEIVQHPGRRAAVNKMLASLDELASSAVVAERAEHFAVADHQLLRERVLFSHGNRVIIAGLRFKNLNPEFPFVQLCANFHISKQAYLEIKEKVASEFAPLLLKGITLRHPPNFFSEEAHEKWSHLVFGKTNDIPNPSLPTGFQMRWGGSVDFYPLYASEFKNFLAENPDKNAYLNIEEEEDLEKAADEGLLMSLWDEKGWLGVIAAKPKDLYGLPCAYIFEIFLAKRARGRGLAPLMQAQFLSGISARHPYVFGHINDSNRPSLRTALSLGRRVIETEYFFPFS